MTTFAERKEMARKVASDSEIWKRIRAGDIDARNEMVEAHLPYVEALATTISRRLPPHVEWDDLYSYGCFGLFNAIDLFDTSVGNFDVYASIKIRGKILDEMRAVDWAPKSLRSKTKELERASSALESELNRTPTDEEIADLLQVDVEQVKRVRFDVAYSTHKSLEEIHPHAENPITPVSSDPSPDEAAHTSSMQQELVGWFDSLDEFSQVVVALYYYKEMTLTEVASAMDVPKPWVVESHAAAAKNLRDIFISKYSLGGEDGPVD